MIRENKKKLMISSLLILLPILVGLLLWDRLPEHMTTHWGLDGQADGWSSLPFAVFASPLLMLAAQWVCVWFTTRDPGNQGRNKKISALVLWIIPVISNLVSGMTYAIALGLEFSPVAPMAALMGLLFAVMGNYLPKTRMNKTIGIKVYWAYTSEENWNATHRFGGKVWFIGGICMIFAALLPEKWCIAVMMAAILVLCVIPVVYSWRYYRKQVQRGDPLDFSKAAMGKTDKKIALFSSVYVVVILAFVLVLMFTGSIDVRLEEDAMHIEASWYDDLTVNYGVIESVEYREGNVDGVRVGGFGSARLLMGFFRNEEFGTYTRYTYTSPEACVVVYTDSRVLVLSGDDAQETQSIYNALMAKIG